MPKGVKCKNCNNLKNHWCEMVIDSPDEDIIRDCHHFWEKTNADRIRAMSDEELAKWLVGKTKYQESAWSPPSYLNFLTGRDDTEDSATNDTIAWLKQPAQEEL